MAKAIRVVMPGTRHRWCRWHVLKSSKKRLGKVHGKHKKFKSDFYNLISNELSVEKFENSWNKLIEKYSLRKNKYMRRLYRYREKWAKPYFMGVFCAGMTSTQRSESANHMLKRYIQKAAPMHLFVSKFNEFLSDRTEQEAREQHVTKMVSRKMRVGVPIEEHADRIYTRAMYEKFYDELFEAGKFRVLREEGAQCYTVERARVNSVDEDERYVVYVNGEESISCQCGFFEHIGMLCRHAIKVLVYLERQEIPRCNIMRRWTKEAIVHKLHEIETSVGSDVDEMRKKALLLQTLQVVHSNSGIDEQMFRNAMDALRMMPALQTSAGTIMQEDKRTVTFGDLETPAACPPRTMKGGRPASTGLKAWLGRSQKKRSAGRPTRDDETQDWPEEERPARKKTKRVSDI
ncbi:protein FAR1-RELATED SEQUENCE 5-like [Panicum virgatum]|uniref:protein FAR1-RELATED SEQUENCE 5-like n=1 Tax=Panicum virgatum TaxID=38727 RepID=UPI0019D631ED|nr:protein FAR1-RELATED SEQUENCE 5-like [Panicum virgatum]